MTEMLNKEFSRKSFLKGGGALIVGFSLAGAALAGKARAADSPFASNGPLDLDQVDSWIAIHADNTASIKTGQRRARSGHVDRAAEIAAEELDMDVSQLKFVTHDTNVTPDTGATRRAARSRAPGPSSSRGGRDGEAGAARPRRDAARRAGRRA